MARPRVKIDKEKLYKMAKAGKNAAEIMAAVGVKSKATFKATLADLMVEKGEVLKISGLRGRSASGTRKVMKTGLLIPLALLEPHFRPGDEFRIEVSAESVVLNKI